ncbi:MAG: OmpA family protein [Puniceicoccales bacterium]|jgi:outer membrane protein OmpA-like peptidoglycan-associated protein|nr:OmpA family protein [Puniceicoccales bacterium]
MVKYVHSLAMVSLALALAGCKTVSPGPSPEATLCSCDCEDTAHYRRQNGSFAYGSKDLVGQVFFAVDDVKLDDDDRRTIKAVAVELNNYPERGVLLVGYCDSKGKEAYNLNLSQKRIEVVAEFLQGEGVSAGRIKGEAKGAAESATHSPAKFDRRVDVMFR